jgi:hypothetical protein
MPTGYTLIASNTVGSGGAASITFSSIAGTYTDLIVKVSARTSGTGTPAMSFYFNGTNTNWSGRGLYGDGSSAYSFLTGGSNAVTLNTSSQTANTFTNDEFYVPNYTSSNFKSVSVDGVTENNATAAYADLTAQLWSSTGVVTSITMAPSTGSFAQYTTAYLYGIKNS